MADYLIIDPLREMLAKVASFIPTFIVGLGILFIGWMAAKVVSKMFHRLLKIIRFDKIADRAGISDILVHGGIKHKLSDLLSSLVYWVVMVMVLIISVKAFGLTMASSLLERLLGYVPSVISGVLILMLGMLLAKVVSGLVYVAAANTDIPNPEMLSRLSKWAIIIYVTVIFLKEIGFGLLFVGTNFTIVFGGVIFALALAFGLAGKDIAARYLDVLKKEK